MDRLGRVGDGKLVFSSVLHHVDHDVAGGQRWRPGVEVEFNFRANTVAEGRSKVDRVWTCRSSCPPGQPAPSPGGGWRWHWTNIHKYSDNGKYKTLSQNINSILICSSSSHLDSVSGLLSRLPSILVEKPEKKMILIFTKCAPNLYRERTVVATIRETWRTQRWAWNWVGKTFSCPDHINNSSWKIEAAICNNYHCTEWGGRTNWETVHSRKTLLSRRTCSVGDPAIRTWSQICISRFYFHNSQRCGIKPFLVGLKSAQNIWGLKSSIESLLAGNK